MPTPELTLDSSLSELPRIGPTLTRHFKALNLECVRDLLLHFPKRYEDFSHLTSLSDLKVGEQVTIHGTIHLISTRRSFKRRMTITEALVDDGTGTIRVTWFNLPYLSKTLIPGTEVFLAGTLERSAYGLQLQHPVLELAEKGGVHTGRLVPIYPTTSSLPQRTIRNLVAKLLPLASQLKDFLPKEIEGRFKLPTLPQATKELHFPTSRVNLEQARRRLAFAELFKLRLRSLEARSQERDHPAAKITFSERTKQFVSTLPFSLTPDQKRAAWETIQDLGKPFPMFRLVQGDVGSGKTIVAGLAALNCLESGYQVAFLAPTELLASQHFVTLTQLFQGWPIRIGLLSRGRHEVSNPHAVVPAKQIKKMLASGEVNLMIGTHALLQQDVKLKQLGLVVVDEQHRFGVTERHILSTNNEGTYPHFLSLSATPIPRSLALSIYGDLDVSVIRNLPPGRIPVHTRVVQPNEREQAYTMMKKEVQFGHRVFIICPLVDESDTLGVRAATSERERLQREVFPDIKLGLLHGRLNSKAKTQAMADFRNGVTPILVSTSVVEVGVDVPNATIMAIEGAERFGLAQLHQFRGRVGRSSLPSYCLLMPSQTNPNSEARLKALVKFPSGFDLAEFDLSSRGPGDLLGELQSGWGNLRFAQLATPELLKSVREATDFILKLDPTLARWPELKKEISETNFHPE